jgi:NADH/NAD ratio-sensing transcriptional regulator Rex
MSEPMRVVRRDDSKNVSARIAAYHRLMSELKAEGVSAKDAAAEAMRIVKKGVRGGWVR